MNLESILQNAPQPIKKTWITGTYEEGSHILFSGEKNDHLYFLTKGQASVYMQNQEGVMMNVNTYYASSIFGEYEVFNPQETSQSVIANTDCQIIRLHKKHLHQWMQADFDLTMYILENFAKDVVHSHQTTSQLAFLTIKERLIVSIYSHDQVGDLDTLTKEIVQQEVYAPIRSLNRSLAACQEEGLFSYRKKTFSVVDPVRLRKIAEAISPT
ncbi:Crp/Fnr family transcriptional regulator [Gottschalkiaceae bacterium SANA]|nr:Crp/Fnr family transcriptional regulator [Gottschalkiaceae bacterium SANA]